MYFFVGMFDFMFFKLIKYNKIIIQLILWEYNM